MGYDEHRKSVVLTFLGNKKDPTTFDIKSQTWYDTSGKFIYTVASKNNVIQECYWYHYPTDSKNYDYTIGYREGALFKEIYFRDEFGASWKKKITITPKEITTTISTNDRDTYGNVIYKISTVPNKTGKVE